MLVPLCALAVLLSACMSSQRATDYSVLVSVQPPAAIERLGEMWGYKGVRGLAYSNQRPCAIFVPPLSKATLYIWVHELRHCTEGSFHSY